MKFTKIQGAGNDFIIINNMEERIPVDRLGLAASQLCRRRISLGADGLMAVDAPDHGGDFKMRFFNADGSEGEMCGNGVRCIARYGYENGLSGTVAHIETMAGMVEGTRIDERMYCIKLNDPTVIRLGQNAEIDGHTYQYDYLELGSPGIPHAAVELPGFPDMEEAALRELGRKLRSYPTFPKGANINFFMIEERHAADCAGGSDIVVLEKTFERGVEDFTLACGTGTGSVAAALTLAGRVSGDHVRVETPGGTLYITVKQTGQQITGLYLTGPTNIVAQGEIMDEDFAL